VILKGEIKERIKSVKERNILIKKGEDSGQGKFLRNKNNFLDDFKKSPTPN